MKKSRLLFFIPMLGLFLSGCDSDKKKDPTISSIAVSGEYKQVYYVGEEFSSSGIVVTATYDDQSKADVSSQATYSGFSSAAVVESQTITVAVGEKTTSYTISVRQTYSFTAAIAAYVEEGIDGLVIPDYKGGTAVNDEYPWSIEIEGTTAEEMDAFAASLEAAGWEVKKDTYGDYHAECGLAFVDIANWLDDYGYVSIEFDEYYTELPVDYVEYILAASYGVEASVPEYAAAEGVLFQVDLSYIYFGVVMIYADGSTEAELDIYYAAMKGAGWVDYVPEESEESEEESSSKYSLVYGESLLHAELAFDKEGYTGIIFWAEEAPPSEEFPSEEIAESLTALGVTDSVPEFSAEIEVVFSWYSGADGLQLSIIFDDESVNAQDVIAAYVADLLAASYTEAGADQYGDMHYTSPNGQLDLCAWDGADIGYDGYVFVDVAVNE